MAPVGVPETDAVVMPSCGNILNVTKYNVTDLLREFRGSASVNTAITQQ
jgi:hypothetical protein